MKSILCHPSNTPKDGNSTLVLGTDPVVMRPKGKAFSIVRHSSRVKTIKTIRIGSALRSAEPYWCGSKANNGLLSSWLHIVWLTVQIALEE